MRVCSACKHSRYIYILLTSSNNSIHTHTHTSLPPVYPSSVRTVALHRLTKAEGERTSSANNVDLRLPLIVPTLHLLCIGVHVRHFAADVLYYIAVYSPSNLNAHTNLSLSLSLSLRELFAWVLAFLPSFLRVDQGGNRPVFR